MSREWWRALHVMLWSTRSEVPMVEAPSDNLDLREQIAHIDLMLTDNARRRQEIQLAPWQLVTTALAGRPRRRRRSFRGSSDLAQGIRALGRRPRARL